MPKDTRNTYERITDAMIAAMENVDLGKWQMPWHLMSMLPRNAYTEREYQGMNTIMLWSAGFASPEWATYNQWEGLGAQVRKGEKGTLGIKWLPVKKVGAEDKVKYLMPWGFVVFNAEQVDGYESKTRQLVDLTERLAKADAVIAATGAKINETGDAACYNPDLDKINMPPRILFQATKTSSATECYYSTKLHELVHWTGSEKRLNRKQATRSDLNAYAFEELVAELGSAFLCGRLGISNEPRLDHAQYLNLWLGHMKKDPRAIIKAATLAQKAVNLIMPPATTQFKAAA